MPAENLYDREERELIVPGSGDRSETEMLNESAPKSQTIFKKAIKVIAVGGGGGNAVAGTVAGKVLNVIVNGY